MARFIAIDLTGLSPAGVVEALDFEAILKELKDYVVERLAEFGVEYDVQDLESDPVVKVLEVIAYRELLLRGRVNNAARAVMLAYAQGSDLDHLGAYYGVQRRLITPAEGDQPAVYESDESLRRRIQLAPEALSTAGPEGAYAFHTLTVDPSIRDVAVIKGEPGHVYVIPLVHGGNGVPSDELLDRIRDRLSEEDIRPLTDIVTVIGPEVVEYSVEVQLSIASGPDPAAVKAAAEEAINKYCSSRHLVGRVVARSGLLGAAHVPGVEKAILISPAEDVDPGEMGTAVPSSISITVV